MSIRTPEEGSMSVSKAIRSYFGVNAWAGHDINTAFEEGSSTIWHKKLAKFSWKYVTSMSISKQSKEPHISHIWP